MFLCRLRGNNYELFPRNGAVTFERGWEFRIVLELGVHFLQSLFMPFAERFIVFDQIRGNGDRAVFALIRGASSGNDQKRELGGCCGLIKVTGIELEFTTLELHDQLA